MVRKGWTKMDVPDGWVQIIRGPRPRSVQWPSVGRQEVPMRSQPSISKPREKAPKQPTPKGHPTESKIGRIEAALKVLGQQHSDARPCLEDVLKKAKAEGVSRDVSSRPPDVSVAEANAKVVRLEGSLAALRPHDVEERRVHEEALSKVRVRATVAPVGQRLDECEKYCERAAKRLEKAQEVVTEALKAHRLAVLRAEAAAQPAPENPSCPGTDELTHLRRQVEQMEGELRQSHRAVSEKSVVENTLKQQVEHLMQEVAALRDRVPPVVGTEVQETALVTAVPRSGSARMEETDKKRLRITDVGGASPTM